ncbi:Gfo/Idh/MocA family oxidoreductase [bacterium]|nr:Gfo/Idh/MocA family oxidoreductase [bacterium]
MSGNGISRRKFLGGSLTAAALAVVPRSVLGAPGQPAPSDTFAHAVVGTGGMGNGHISYVLGDKRRKLLAVCDVDDDRLARAQKRGGQSCTAYTDFRHVLDRGDIDVVHVPTPPHWHALVSIMAAQAGCDIWCEKPMTRTIGEGQHVIDAVRKAGAVFRLNTWFRLHGNFYGLGTPVKPIKQLVANGLLGWPLTVRVSRFTGFNWKVGMWSGKTHVPPQPVPKNLHYDMWLGPAPVKPYHPHRVHGSFRGYWDYDGGGLADMGQHYLDGVQYILGKDHTSPVEIEAYAPWPPHDDAVGSWGRVELKYEDGCRLVLESGEWGQRTTEGKPYIEGPKGKIYPGFRCDPVDLKDALPLLPEPERQISDFTESVITRQPFGLNEVNGNRSNMLVHLANAAIRTGRKLRFDPVTQRFIGDDEANRLVDQPMRAPWRL